MGSRKGDGRPGWVEELGDVRPLRDRDARRPDPAAAPKPRPIPEAPVCFEVERRGETLRALAPGIDREQLRRLARGRVPVEATLDLHGLDAATARRRLRETLLGARETGARCLLVVHGRGIHSAEAAVLKQALPEWLTETPLGGAVMAFASATPEHGGPGATYVLLRRARR